LDVRAADYDGDGRADLITFDGIGKQVWLGNTRLPDGLPLEVWFEHDDHECEQGDQTKDKQDLVFTSNTWIATGAYTWRSRNGLTTGCDPSSEDCEAGLVTRQMFVEFLAWIDGLHPATGISTNAAGWALVQAGHQIPCDIRNADCWDESMPLSELSSYFGQFLASRRGDVPPPHRWIVPGPVREPTKNVPR
jgi:hypothetical protein